MTYTTDGEIRGSCGHRHRSIETARECVSRDRRGCRRQGGYSDRNVVRCDGEPMTEDEQDKAFGQDDEGETR